MLRSAVASFLLLAVSSARAITLGQVDNFQGGTLAGWGNGGVGGAPPVLNVADGGPAGAGDRFLQIISDGGGAGGRLTAFNRTQWLGNYLAAGVTAIEVDLQNLGPTSLSIRLAFKGSLSMGAPAYLTTAAVLAPGSGWQHFTFSLLPTNLIPVAGPPAYNTLFSTGLAEVRFINEIAANNSNGDILVGQVGIDNVRAVPEPAVSVLLAGALLLAGTLRMRRRRATA